MPLSHFAVRLTQTNRIRYGDVRKIQRDLLPDGIMTREEAEILIELDRNCARADAAWGEYLIAALVDFVVWGSRPTGRIDADTARWLVGALSRGGRTKTALAIARGALQECEEADRALAAFAGRETAPAPAAADDAQAAAAPC